MQKQLFLWELQLKGQFKATSLNCLTLSAFSPSFLQWKFNRKMQVHTHFKAKVCSEQDQLLHVLCSAAPHRRPHKQEMPQRDRNSWNCFPWTAALPSPSSQHMGNPSSATDEVPGWHPTQNQGTLMERRETIPTVQSYVLWNFLFSSKHVILRTCSLHPPLQGPQQLTLL